MIRIICAMTMVSVAISGCARMSPAALVYCEVEQPITWSSKDTDRTIAEVKSHNAVYKSLCPKRR